MAYQERMMMPGYPPQSRAYQSPNLSQGSNQSDHSQSQKSAHSRASMRQSTNGIPVTESRGLEAAHILDHLQREIVLLTGGRDRQGGPLLIFPPNRNEYFLPNDITACLKYLYQIPSEESKCRGFTVIIDSRDGSWSNLVTILGCLKQSLGDYLKQVLVLPTEEMNNIQPSSSSFSREQGPNIEPQFINLNRLYTYVDRNQLIGSMGGTLMYHHRYWLQNRLDLEKFVREARVAASHLDSAESEISFKVSNQSPESKVNPMEALHQHRKFQESILSIPDLVIKQGNELLQKLIQYSDVSMHGEESVTTLDNLEATKHVKRTLHYLESRVDKINTYFENRDQILNINIQKDTVQKEIRQVVDWILGPGEKLLASQSDIGDSFERAEALRKCHEELEIKCTDTYGHYAELRYRAEDVLNMPTVYADDIRAQRDYMDIVCRSFATRLERRRNLLITSVRFHRLTEEFSRKLDDLLEVLYNEKEADTVEAAQEALEHLQEKLEEIDQAASRAIHDGQSLLDEMSRPVKNAAGKDISPDYAKQMKHVNQRLEDLQERKMRCDELADVRKLRLKHFLQLHKCEQDIEKAISWIVELCEVMLTTQTHIGQTQQDIEQLQDKHKELETTARKTYQYGQQLLQASLDLRQSLRLTPEPNTSLVKQLDEAWKKFSLGNNERTNRLNVASMFLAQSDKLWERIEQLMVVVAQTLTGDVLVQNALTQFGPEKHAVEREVKDTSRMGKALLERLSLPVIVVDGQERTPSKEDQIAIESVNSRLRKLHHKITELNRYWSDMEKTGQPPYVTPRFSKSSLQPYPFNQGPQSVLLPQRDRKYETLPPTEQTELPRQSYPFDQSQKSASLPARKKRHSSINNKNIPQVIKKGSVSKSDGLRRSAEMDQSQFDGKRQRSADSVDKAITNGQSQLPTENYSVQLVGALPGTNGNRLSIPQSNTMYNRVPQQEPPPHVSQSYYPKSEEFLRHVPPSSFSSYMDQQQEMGQQDGRNKNLLSKEPQPFESGVDQIHPDSNQLIHSQPYFYSQSQPNLHSPSELEIHETFRTETKLEVPKISTETAKAEPKVSKMLHAFVVPDTLPISKSTPDISRGLPPKVDIMPKVHIKHRSDSPPKSFQELLTKFQTGETEKVLESQEKSEVQKELSQVRKSRAMYLDDEDKVMDRPREPEIKKEVEKALDWYQTTGKAQLQRTELGDSLESARCIQADHQRLEHEARDIQDTVQQLIKSADQLLCQTQHDSNGIRKLLLEVDAECKSFMSRLDIHKQNITLALLFFQLAEMALKQLNEIEGQLNTTDLPRSSTQMAQRHALLYNAIMEECKAAQIEGHRLLDRVSRDDTGADGVRRKMHMLQTRFSELQSIFQARRAEVPERSKAYVQFQESCSSMQTWVTQVVQPTLGQHNDMGSTLAEATDFLHVHEQLHENIRGKNVELIEAAKSMVKSGDHDARATKDNVEHLQQQQTRLLRVTEVRIKLCIIYISFLRVVQQHESSMRSLEHKLKLDAENLQDLTDSAVTQMEEDWSNVETALRDIKDKGRQFIQNSSTVTDDSLLQIHRTVQKVEDILHDIGDHMKLLTMHWESWHTHVSTRRQFKTQWLQFMQDARKSIDKVQKVENGFVPILSGDLSTSLDKANACHRHLDQLMPECEMARAELENHIKTAEMLSLKGDTRGQKEQIVSELVNVHQRFNTRIQQYQILLKMIIPFLKKLDQLDKVIVKSEQEYLQSELPQNINRMESMMEEHKKKKQEISDLVNTAVDEAERISRVKQTDAEAITTDDVQKILSAANEYKRRWNHTLEEQERRLQQNLKICHFNFNLQQIHSEIDKLQHQQTARSSYDSSSSAANITLSPAFKQFEMAMELLEKKVQNFTSTAESMILDKNYESLCIHHEIDKLKTKWTSFHTSVQDFKDAQNMSVEYFKLIDKAEQWMTEGNNLLLDIGERASLCCMPEDANELIQTLNRYTLDGKPQQEDRLRQIFEIAAYLYGNEVPSHLNDLHEQYQDLMQNIQQAVDEVNRLKQRILEQQSAAVEESVPVKVRVITTTPPPKPPTITQQLMNAEVMESTKVILECHIESEMPYDVRWFKDGLPLSSPDYETRIQNNVATLMIEETFLDDTAWYSVLVHNAVGKAESSAYLQVIGNKRATGQPKSEPSPKIPIIQQELMDIMTAEGKRIKLEVVFSASPAPQITWYRGMDKLMGSHGYTITNEPTRSILEITEAYPEDSGQYCVIIKNPVGEVQSLCTVTIESFYSSAAVPKQFPVPTEDMSVVSLEEPVAPAFVQLLLPAREVIEGSRVRLDCVLIGNPEPEVTWYHNGKPIKESSDIQLLFEGDRCTLVIREALLEDAGNYRVTARNEHGEAENFCELHVEPLSELSDASFNVDISAPKFTQLLKDVTTNEGQIVTLQCRVQGLPMPTVQWYKDNKPLEFSKDVQVTALSDVHKLTISKVSAQHGGHYMVKAKNKAGEAKCQAKLSVKPALPSPEVTIKKSFETKSMTTPEITHSPPEFLKLFQDKVVKPGDSVTLECVIVGCPKPKVSWFVNGEPVVSQDYQMTMDGDHYALHIPEVFDEDAGRFSITAENTSGKATCSGMLYVEEPLPADITPVGSHVSESLSFDKHSSSSESLTSTETPVSEHTVAELNQKSPTYIPSMEEEHKTLATEPKDKVHPDIKAHEKYSTTSMPDIYPKYHSVYVTDLVLVPTPPKFLQALTNVTTTEGTSSIFQGVVTGKPQPTIKWYKDGKDITDEQDFEISFNDGHVQFIIFDTYLEDAGTYICKATNETGEAISSAELIVKASMVPPSFTEKLHDISIKEGEPVKFTVRVAGTPAPEVTWFRKDQQLVSSHDFEIIEEGDIHTLYIPEVYLEDAGMFTVQAHNPAGRTQASANLVVKEELTSREMEKTVIKPWEITEPSRSPGTQIAQKRPYQEEPQLKDSKTQKPFETSKPETFTDHVEMHIDVQPRSSEYNKKIPLFGIPVAQQDFVPEKKVTSTTEIPKFGIPIDEQPLTPAKPMVHLKERPSFIKPLQDQQVREGDKLKFEVTFKGQPESAVKWYHSNTEIQSSADVEISYSKEKSSLSFAEVIPEDAGQFKCVITNADGSASSEACLTVIQEPTPPPLPASLPPTLPFEQEVRQKAQQPRRAEKDFFIPRSNRILESNIDYRMSQPEEVEYQQVMEDEMSFQVSHFEDRLQEDVQYQNGKIRFASETETSEYDSEVPEDRLAPESPPQIVQKMKDVHLIEGSDATFISKIVGKPRPKIAWYKDGHRVKRSNRYEIKYDRDGFCTLRIRVALPEDAGYYTVLAVNALGKETCSSQLLVEKVGNIDATSFVQPDTLDRILRRDSARHSTGKDVGGVIESQQEPQFKMQPSDMEVREGHMVRFDTLVTGRPEPELTWICNNVKVLPDENHKMVVNEDGVHSLIIAKVTPHDAGIYTCRAENKGGQSSFNVKITVIEREQMLAPKFVEPMQNYTVKEGQSVTLTTRAVGTPTPMMSWQKNNKTVTPSKDYRIDIDNGRTSLYIEDAKKADSAWFQCTAVNVAGSASTRAKLVVQPEEKKTEPVQKITIVPRQTSVHEPSTRAMSLSQIPSKEDARDVDVDHDSAVREYMRREGEAPAPEDLYTKSKQQPPQFKTKLKDVINLKENEPIHFECKLVPIGDPSMKVEWFKDGQPLLYGHRFKASYASGFVSLDILYMYPEDSGEYSCEATNACGVAKTSSIVRCRGGISIIMDTQISKQGAVLLQEMEDIRRGQTVLEKKDAEEPKVKVAPTIDVKPEPVEVKEGNPAKFMVRVGSHPQPRVSWFLNGSLIVGGTRYKVTYDGMMYYLEIPHARAADAGQVRVVAKNSEGEDEASTTLGVIPLDDLRSKLRQAPRGDTQLDTDHRQKHELQKVDKPVVTEYSLKDDPHSITTEHGLEFDKHSEQWAVPARIVRPDSPEIQLARMVPIIPEPEPKNTEPSVSEEQDLLYSQEPPMFTKPLRPARISEGKPVQMEVHFKGYPPPLITWYRDSFEIRSSPDFQIVTTETASKLTISEVFSEDTGMVTVKAYNVNGMVQCKAKLTVVEEEEPSMDIAPEVRNPIHDMQVLKGEQVIFECHITGHPRPTVHWEKDGKMLEDAAHIKFHHEEDNYMLIVFDVRAEDAGNYACVAMNNVGMATCTAKLLVESADSEQRMSDLHEESAEVKKFGGSYGSPEKLTTEETEDAAIDMTREDLAECQETNYFKFVTTRKTAISPTEILMDELALADVNKAAEMSEEMTISKEVVIPNDVITEEGEVTSVDSKLELSMPKHHLEWRWTPLEEEQPKVVSYEEMAPVDHHEETIFPTTLPTSGEAPQFITPLTNIATQHGEPVQFMCVVTGYPRPNVHWFLDSELIPEHSTTYRAEYHEDGTCTLFIKESFQEDEGEYKIEATNDFGTVQCAAILTVTKETETTSLEETTIPIYETEEQIPRTAPKFSTQLEDIYTTDGGMAKFEAVIIGHPCPEVTWLKDGNLVEEAEEFQISKMEDVYTLAIPDVYLEDAGKYTVVAKNDAGTVTSTAELFVKAAEEEMIPPSFSQKPKFQNVHEGSQVSFVARVIALPKPDIFWSHNGYELEQDDFHIMEVIEDVHMYTVTLTMPSVTPEDAGTYKCTATNEAGEEVVSASLIVKEAPIQTDLRSQLKKEVKTKVGGKKIVEQVDFRDNLQTKVKTKEGVKFDAEQADFRETLKTKVQTKVGEHFDAEQVDYRDNLKTKVHTKVGQKYEAIQVDYRDEALKSMVQTKEKVQFEAVQVDYRDVALKSKVQTREQQQFEAVQVDYRDVALKSKVQTREQQQFEAVQVDYRDVALKSKVQTREQLQFEVEQRDYRDALKRKMENMVDVPFDVVQVDISASSKDIVTVETPEQKPTGNVQAESMVFVTNDEEQAAPEFIKRLEDVSVKERKPVKLVAMATGHPTPTITWYHDNEPIYDGEFFKIRCPSEGESMLMIPEVFIEDAGVYTACAANEVGNVECSCTLDVAEPVDAAEQLDFRVALTNSVQTKIGQQFDTEQVDFRSLLKPAAQKSKKFATDVSESATVSTEQPGPERLEVVPIAMQVENNKLCAPEFILTLSDQTIQEGECVTLICKVHGRPVPEVTWYHDDKPIVSDDVYRVIPGEDGISSLKIPETFPEDSGVYLARASNDVGTAECQAVLTVTGLLEIDEEEPSKKYAEAVGDDVNAPLENPHQASSGFELQVTAPADFDFQQRESTELEHDFQPQHFDINGIFTGTITNPNAVSSKGPVIFEEKVLEDNKEYTPNISGAVYDHFVRQKDISTNQYITELEHASSQRQTQGLTADADVCSDSQVVKKREIYLEEEYAFRIPNEKYLTDRHLGYDFSVRTEDEVSELPDSEIASLLSDHRAELERRDSDVTLSDREYSDRDDENVVISDSDTESPFTEKQVIKFEEVKLQQENNKNVSDKYKNHEVDVRDLDESSESLGAIPARVFGDQYLLEINKLMNKPLMPGGEYQTWEHASSTEDKVPNNFEAMNERPEMSRKLDIKVTIQDSKSSSEEEVESDTSSYSSQETRKQKQYIFERTELHGKDRLKDFDEFDGSVNKKERSLDEHHQYGQDLTVPRLKLHKLNRETSDSESDVPHETDESNFNITTDLETSGDLETVVDKEDKTVVKARFVEMSPVDSERKTTDDDSSTIKEEFITHIDSLEKRPQQVIEVKEYVSSSDDDIPKADVESPIFEKGFSAELDLSRITEEGDESSESKSTSSAESVRHVDISTRDEILQPVPEEGESAEVSLEAPYEAIRDTSFDVDESFCVGSPLAKSTMVRNEHMPIQFSLLEEPEKRTDDIGIFLDKPRFIQDLSDLEVTEGDTVTLFVQVEGTPFPTMIWYRDGIEIEADDRHTIDIRGNFASLIMKDIQPEDDAEYSVVALNEAGTVSSKCELFVNPLGDAPSFVTSIEDIEVHLGSPINLHCQVRGTPKKIIWMKDGVEIQADRYKTSYEEEIVSLTIENSIPEDEGEYTIKAINEKGIATSSAEVLVHLEAPIFRKQLSDVIVEVSDTAIFQCIVTGIPAPKVSWLIEDTPVVDGPKYSTNYHDNVATFEIKDVSMDDSQIFVTCKAENVAGEARTSAELSVEEQAKEEIHKLAAPKFIINIQTIETTVGDKAVFFCKAKGNPKPEILWYKEGRNISNKDNRFTIKYGDDGDSSLLIVDVVPEHDGKYMAEAKNVAGSVTCAAELFVHDKEETFAPEFIKSPKEVVAREYSCARFLVKVIGMPRPTVTWKKDDQMLVDKDFYYFESYEDTFCFEIKETNQTDAGTYVCIATNDIGEAICEISLEVKVSVDHSAEKPLVLRSQELSQPPEFTEMFTDLIAMEEKPMTLTCKVFGLPRPDLTWFKDNVQMKPSLNIQQSYEEFTAVLTINKMTMDMDGVYKCVAENSAGTAENVARITVEGKMEKPEFTRTLADRVCREGRPVKFECAVKGIPKPDIKWYINNKPIAPGLKFHTDQRTGYAGHYTHSLSIDSTEIDHAGRVKVIASNKAGEVEITASLIVEEKKEVPKFSRKLENMDTIEKQTITFEVEVTGKPKPHVTWSKNDTELKATEDILIEDVDNVHTLTIKNVCPNDAAIYSVKAHNPAGQTTCSARLNVAQIPIEIIAELTEQHVYEHETLYFTCEVSKPDVIVTWFKNDQKIVASEKHQILDDGAIHTLMIINTDKSDVAEYTVVVNNKTTSALLHLDGSTALRGPVQITCPLHQCEVNRNHSVSFTCHLSHPNVPVTWLRDGIEITKSTKYTFAVLGHAHKLTIHQLDWNDKAVYTLKINASDISSSAKLFLDDLFQKDYV